MTVYQKLAQARLAFQSGNPKMSGENTFAKYKYFELGDILPIINKLSVEIGFVCEVSFTADLATLIFRDSEVPESFAVFTSPMSTAQLKGCHEVQNLGAVETYIKRYLYQNAFEIVENDALNKTQGQDDGASEYGKLKEALIDWLNVTPPVFTPEQASYANKAISDKNIEGMKTAIKKATEKAAKA